jgi:hypothetical protein
VRDQFVLSFSLLTLLSPFFVCNCSARWRLHDVQYESRLPHGMALISMQNGVSSVGQSAFGRRISGLLHTAHWGGLPRAIGTTLRRFFINSRHPEMKRLLHWVCIKPSERSDFTLTGTF